MSEAKEVLDLLQKQGEAFDAFTKKNNERLETLDSEILEIQKKANRPGVAGNDSTTDKPETFIDVKTGQHIPVLSHKDRLSAYEQRQKSPLPSFGRLLRGIVLGGRADDAAELMEERKALGIFDDSSGGYTVQDALASEYIDLLRANMVLSKAGCRTVPMSTKNLSLARVTGDPTVYWHGENAEVDLGEPTFGAVNLSAKTATCLVKLSLELSQDSVNIEQILSGTITQAMAHAIDKAGLVGVTTDAAAAPTGIMNATGRNKVTSVGAPTNYGFLVDGIYELMLDNVPLENIGAFIAHPAVYKKLAKIKTGISGDESILVAPVDVARLPKLYTTAAPLTGGTTANGIIADWRSLIMGVRKDITVRVLTESFMGSNLQLAILAYARVDFAATRETDFCTLEGITV